MALDDPTYRDGPRPVPRPARPGGELEPASVEAPFARAPGRPRLEFAGSPWTGALSAQIRAGADSVLVSASETLNQSTSEWDGEGERANIISPVVIPKDSRSFLWLFPAVVLAVVGIV